MAAESPVMISGQGLTIEEVVDVARGYRTVVLDPSARRRVELCREVVDHLVDRRVKVYGITTGFASLRNVSITQPEELSRRLIVSHATGVGAPFPEDVVRAAMLLRAHTLARGCSGARPLLVDMLLAFLNARVYPLVPCQGSCGSSGDLAPLSHLMLPMIATDQLPEGERGRDGEGTPGGLIYRSGAERACPVRDARAGDFAPTAEVGEAIRGVLGEELASQWPVRLTAKEGLALNNGAVFCTAMLAIAVADAESLIDTSEQVTALGFEAIQAVPDCLHPAITTLRAHPGHIRSAEAIRVALEGSGLVPPGGSFGLSMASLNRVQLDLASLERDCTARQEALTAPGHDKEHDELRQLLAALPTLRTAAASVYDDLPARVARARQSASGDPNSYPKQREIIACSQVMAECLQIWTEMLRALSATLTGGAWFERLRAVYTDLRSVVPASPETQENYSFRAAATVLGAARDTATMVRTVAETDINSVTDNPIIALDEVLDAAGLRDEQPEARERLRDWLAQGGWRAAAGSVRSAANFHGQPIGTAADQLKIIMAEVGDIAERRVACLTDSRHSKGLPPYLVWRPGLNSGFMMPQYTAASLVTENRAIAFPASTDSVPTGEGAEDHNAMATTACRYCQTVIENVTKILAIETLCAYQAVQFRKPGTLGRGTSRIEALLAERLGGTVYPDRETCRMTVEGWGLPAEAARAIRPCYLTDQSHTEAIGLAIGLIEGGALRA